MEANQYYVKYPVMQIRPYGLLCYDRYEWSISRKEKKRGIKINEDRSKQNNADGTVKGYTGKMTPYSKKKIKRAIQLIVASSKWKEAKNFKTGKMFKFKVNFITLTLPASQGNITDKEIKKECLDNWIKRMKRKHKLNSYVWRAEKQKNGNLHFHIITDVYIHYEKIRSNWNDVLQKFKMIDKFEEKNGHRNPNSTDVHAIGNVKNLSQYFVKYMAKDEKEGKIINGKLWDCSKNLKTKKNCEMLLEGEARELWEKCLENQELQVKSESTFCIIFLDTEQFGSLIIGKFLKLWNEYLEEVSRAHDDHQNNNTHAFAA
jgi:hypothetical protein